MGIIERARALRNAVDRAASALPDAVAYEVPELYREWDGNDHFYEGGERVTYNGELYKVLQAHPSQTGWTPEDAPSLFAKVLPGQDGTEIGEWVQPDSTNPYMAGDRVLYNGKVYESIIDNNIWSPDAYPGGWSLVE